MNKEIVYWKWKNTIIDFDVISNETIDYNEYITKKDYIFHYLGAPDRQIHEWYNGGFSSEYNSALRYARQLGLVENYVDYENKIYDLEQQVKKQKEVIDKISKYLEKFIPIDEDIILMRIGQRDYLLNILKEVSDE